MKNLFWILLLANVLLFTVMQGGGWGDTGTQAQPELHPEMIRLMLVPQDSPAKVPAPVAATPGSVSAAVSPAPASSPAPSSSQLQMTMNMAAPVTDISAATCWEWGDFSGPDLARAKSALAELQLVDKLSQRQIEHEVGYWVYMSPLRNRAAVNRKIAELKALGVSEYFVVQGSGIWQNAISLGVFKTRDAAQNFLHVLNGKGVRTARVGERTNKIKSTLFLLSGLDAPTAAKLNEMQKDFAGTELSKVACGLTR